ncbi:VrrA/YqfQ family protein [Aquibacillus kalidii]|uniref:VrrA/YqfQ family protein n=1 Tax=Aquibacillus kalidii TaxID=2762597 RepID=UPI0016484541|nr:VrrA/YqfQ family protein [Aquibacillus kalidii]
MFKPPQGRSPFTQMGNRGPMGQIGRGMGSHGPSPMRQMGQLGQMGQQAASRTSSGGIKGMLQKFIKPSGAGQGVTGIANAATSGGGLTSKLGNIQQVMKMAQSATPLIREYGPMVKNIPTMVRMLKAFNEAEDDDENEDDENVEVEPESMENEEEEKKAKVNVTKESINKIDIDAESYKKQKSKRSENKEKTLQGTSRPKLFV